MTGDRTPLRERLAGALPCPACDAGPGVPCLRANVDVRAPHKARLATADAVLPVVEEALSQAERRAVQTGNPAALYREQVRMEHERAEKAEAEVAQWRRDVRTYARNEGEQRKRAEKAEAAVERVRALAEQMRTWCSPHGVAVDYAARILEALEPPKETP